MVRAKHFVLILASLTAPAAGQVPTDQAPRSGITEPERPATTPDRNREFDAAEAERERLRAAFIEARREFAAATAAALTSAELKGRVQEFAARARLRRVENDLFETQAALRELAATGRLDTERGQRLTEQSAALEREAEQLRHPDGEAPALFEIPVGQDAAQRLLEGQMAEETLHLADTLSARELQRNTRRLKRLAALARFAGGGRNPGNPAAKPGVQDPQVVPAGGVQAAKPLEEFGIDASLGRPTESPPRLPPADEATSDPLTGTKPVEASKPNGQSLNNADQ